MYGFGRNMDTLSDEDAAKAKMWEMVGLTVAFVTSTSSLFRRGHWIHDETGHIFHRRPRHHALPPPSSTLEPGTLPNLREVSHWKSMMSS